jgi:hypothetical protein
MVDSRCLWSPISSSTRPIRRLLVSLLPSLVHVRGVERLSVLVRIEEASERRSGRDLVLTRLVEVLLIGRLCLLYVIPH